ncbi:MAG TPA: hypothetical protein VJP79_02240 [Nitrososphaera sp.]|nr:hypothetical protein [Nitrososphaera sp.]
MSNDSESNYTCDTCPMNFKSLKELTAHYKKEHPDMIEKILMPI